jgi:hypothetical protein
MALTNHAHALPRVDTSGNAHADGTTLGLLALAATIAARSLDGCTAAATGRTRHLADDLAQRRVRNLSYLSESTTGRAGNWACRRLCPGTSAAIAGSNDLDLDVALHTNGRFA